MHTIKTWEPNPKVGNVYTWWWWWKPPSSPVEQQPSATSCRESFLKKMENEDMKLKLVWWRSPLYPWIFLTLPILREMWSGRSWCSNWKCTKWKIESITSLPQVWGLQKTTETQECYIESRVLDPKSLRLYLWIDELLATNSPRSLLLFDLWMEWKW